MYISSESSLQQKVTRLFYNAEYIALDIKKSSLISENDGECLMFSSGILYGDHEIPRYNTKVEMQGLRRRNKGIMHNLAHINVVTKVQQYLAERNTFETKVNFLTNYFIAVRTTFSDRDQQRALMPQNVCSYFTTDEENPVKQPDEKVDAFIAANQKYLKEIKAQMLLQLIQGDK